MDETLERNTRMRIFVITQKIDEDDDVLGFFVNWVRALSKEADEVDVLCLAKGNYNLPKNVRIRSLGKENGNSKFFQAIKFYFYAFDSLCKADGVFVHMAPEYVKALYPLNIFFRKPIVMWYAHIKVSKTAKWAIDHVNYIMTPSKESFEFDSPKVVSTGHGIDPDIFKPEPYVTKEPESILSLSRISKVKRIETLIEAAKILVYEKGKTNIRIDIYGKPARAEDVQYLQDLRDRAIRYKLEKNVFWSGSVANADAPDVYRKHSIFVRMQGGGGFGKTELEAMSIGIPAILPAEVYKKDLGEYAEDLLFAEDDAEGLADRIDRVLRWSQERQTEYSKRVRDWVREKHNVKNLVHTIVVLFEKALDKNNVTL